MVQRDGYAAGTPIWVDAGVPDIEAALAFYGGLLGWEAPPADPEAGGYRVCHLRGLTVAGLGPQQAPGAPFWATYVSTDDVDATTERVLAAGGAVVMPKMAVMDQGEMAVYADDTGTFFSVWQPGEHKGAQLVDEPGALCWNELLTRQPEQAAAFYSAVFGWEPHPVTGDSPVGGYTEWRLDGRSIGGMMDMTGHDIPGDMPNTWTVYFGVEDADAAVATVVDLGGAVLRPAFDIPQGRVAVVADPAGTTFQVIALNGDLAG